MTAKSRSGRKGPKTPVVAQEPSAGKKPVALPPKEVAETHISWRFSKMDMTGEWSWKKLDRATLEAVRLKLSEYEKKTWAESYSKKGAGVKQVQTAGIVPAAEERLRRLQLDDAPGLWEFRLTGTQRVWGVRIGEVCYLIWWDPNHTVWPSSTKRRVSQVSRYR